MLATGVAAALASRKVSPLTYFFFKSLGISPMLFKCSSVRIAVKVL